MFSLDSQEQLIRRLACDLAPVHRLASPGRQVLQWLACLVAIAAPLALTCNPTTAVQRLAGSPDVCVGVIGSMLTALLGAAAAFVLSRPDRPPSWALLPAPAAALWIVNGAIGCFRQEAVTGNDFGPPVTAQACFFFILGAAMPLSMLLMALLRRGYSLRPDVTSVLCGLASAAAATTITNIIHPHDANASHIALHGLAVGVIVVSNRMLGHWVLDTKKQFPCRNKSSSARE
jgi:hypothetical protein